MLRSVVLFALLISLSATHLNAADNSPSVREPAAEQGASAADVIEVKITRHEPGNMRVTETQILSRAEFIALVGNESARAKGAYDPAGTNGPPPLPNPPLPGSLPDSTTSIEIHQQLDNWTRDTIYGRAPGGDWFMVKDLVEMHGPPKCNPNDDDCGRLPN